MKISKLIADLQKIQKRCGDVKVMIASDPEGNSYGNFGRKVDWSMTDDSYKSIAIFPIDAIDAGDM